MADLVVVYWRDIPAQVKAGSGRMTVRRELSPRFAEAIDMAAMRSGARDSDTYLAEWRTGEPQKVEGDLTEAVHNMVAALESAWDEQRIAAAIENGGRNG